MFFYSHKSKIQMVCSRELTHPWWNRIFIVVYVYNHTDRTEALTTTPFLQVQNNTEYHLIEAKYNSSRETFKTQSPPAATQRSHNSSKEASGLQLECSAEDDDDTRYFASSMLGENKTHISHTENSNEKIPSNVKKMISTFESSLFQVMLSCFFV